ncbi:hypothetical protein BJ912DRAFT_981873 [Pholiota molesta]|nr:hypothetical protein BJ912DRAFT_981873 [Pholiota molesta]
MSSSNGHASASQTTSQAPGFPNPNIPEPFSSTSHHNEIQPSAPASTINHATRNSTVKINYELPTTVQSIRDGWQWTSSSGAVVSGLLASAAAQLLGSFKTDPGLSAREPRFRNLVLIFCYAGLFLNISATIGSFVLTDNLGELGYRASKKENIMGSTSMGAEDILKKYGASKQWKYMLFHWLITFYLGILSLIVAVLSYVWLEETLPIAITMSIIVALTLFPISYFILIRPIFVDRQD